MILRSTLAFLSLLTLFACNSADTEQQPIEILIAEFSGRSVEPSQRFKNLVRAQAPELQVSFIEKKFSTTLLLESRTGPFETWLSSDGASITTDKGILHSTRGIGAELLASDLSEPLGFVLAGRGGISDRLMTFLDGNDLARTETYRCQIKNEGTRSLQLQERSVATRLMSEACRNLQRSFKNLYWVSSQSGKIVQTRQWTSDYTGEIATRVVFK